MCRVDTRVEVLPVVHTMLTNRIRPRTEHEQVCEHAIVCDRPIDARVACGCPCVAFGCGRTRMRKRKNTTNDAAHSFTGDTHTTTAHHHPHLPSSTAHNKHLTHVRIPWRLLTMPTHATRPNSIAQPNDHRKVHHALTTCTERSSPQRNAPRTTWRRRRIRSRSTAPF